MLWGLIYVDDDIWCVLGLVVFFSHSICSRNKFWHKPKSLCKIEEKETLRDKLREKF